jgi:hypothetical protein
VVPSNVLLEFRHDNKGNRNHQVADSSPEDKSEDGSHKLLIDQTSANHDPLPEDGRGELRGENMRNTPDRTPTIPIGTKG